MFQMKFDFDAAEREWRQQQQKAEEQRKREQQERERSDRRQRERKKQKRPAGSRRMVNHYKVLGVLKAATALEIRAAWVRLVKQHHPDFGGDPAKFRKVQEAYEFLRTAQRNEVRP